ncbi:accessory Sec system protein Asp3 [Streptococcus suis]|uniref:accessory Sec system protein Asp3 n=1 Tax=Streptococcus suis TaxID=1307 RepID=UPI0015D5193D|nr:accessory Sec system protein Asp3 [Streptococcus suis]
MRLEIKWNHFAQDTYSYGSRIDFEKEAISFENPLMPPSFEIKHWYSRTNFQAKRQTPTLPILKKGASYQLILDAEAYPQGSIYLRVVFFDRFGKELGFEILKDKKASFTYPKEAYSYEIALLNAGCERLTFRSIWLQSVFSPQEELIFLEEKCNPTSSSRLHIVFLEHPEDVYYEKDLFAECIDRLGDIVFVSDRADDVSMFHPQTEQFIMDCVARHPEARVQFFAYGPRGNLAATYYSEKIKPAGLFLSSVFYPIETYHSLLEEQGISLSHVEDLIKRARREREEREDVSEGFVSSLVHPLRFLIQQFLDKDGS